MLATETKITITTLIQDVAYDAASRSFVVTLASGGTLTVPVDNLKMELHGKASRSIIPLDNPTDAQLSQVEVWGGGRSIDIACLKQNFGIKQLWAAIT